jgi:hypothetical protein
VIGLGFTVLFIVAAVEVTHGWALIVPGIVVLCWGAHRFRSWGDRSVAAYRAEFRRVVRPFRRK